ncbi:MAG: PQQ-binding-like beta-propeller repeat protein, partial [Pirellulales bacterium]
MNPRYTIRIAGCFLAVAWAARAEHAQGENWPQWRGAHHSGISQETGLPLVWSKTQSVVWRLALPGPAGATPVVWDRYIFLTSADGESLVLMAVDTDGKLLWKQAMDDENKTVRGDEGNSASPSPSTDGKHVWAMMGTGEIGCYTFGGEQVWKFNLQERYGKFDIMFGMTSTPVLDGDRLYLQLLHSGDALVLALDKATGREIWKQHRPSDARAECEHSYSSPTLYRDGPLELLLTHGCDF